ncbi:TPA: Chitinase 2 [Trebouxia sp. C0006]
MVMLGFLDIFGNGADLTQQKNYVNIAFHSLSETQAGIASSGREAGDFIDWRRCCQLWLVQIWNVYLGGTSSARPFGTSILDGVDLDIEEPSTGSQFYPDFVDKLTSLWSGPFPDAQLGTALSSRTSAFDYVPLSNSTTILVAMPATTMRLSAPISNGQA